MQWPGGATNVAGHAGSLASRAASFVDASPAPPLLLVLLVDPLDVPPPLEDEEEDDEEVDDPSSTDAVAPPQAAIPTRAATMERLLTT